LDRCSRACARESNGISLVWLFDKGLQSRQRIVPLTGDAIEGAARLVDRLRLELEELFASLSNASDEAGVLEDAKMLGDRLPREGGAFGQARDRTPRAAAELSQEREPCLVTERGEYGGAFAL
jgi:hypothetical protein